MPGIDDINVHSEELQEVFGTPPRWLVRWGTTIAFFAFAAMILVAYYVIYPDTIKAEITLELPNPPIPIIAESIGTIESIKIPNDAEVEPGQLLLIYASAANPKDIDTLEKDLRYFAGELSVRDIENFTPRRNLQLGSVQDSYSNFLKNYDDFIYGKLAENDKKSISRLNQQIASLERSIKFESEKESDIIIKDTINAREKARIQRLYVNDPDRYADKLGELAMETKKIKLEYKNLTSAIAFKRQEIQTLQIQIAEIRQQSGVDNSTLRFDISKDVNILKGEIKTWKKNHLVYAPVGGRLVFFENFENENQSVQEGTKILEIIQPGEVGEIFGKVDLPIEGSGKVDTGQLVIIKLHNYPFHEYGVLNGIVQSKSDVQQGNNTFRVDVTLSNALLTNKGIDLEFSQGLEGTAEIITREERFLIRMFENVFDF